MGQKNDVSTSEPEEGSDTALAGSGERPRTRAEDPEPEALSSADVTHLLEEASRWLVLVPAGPLHRELELALDRYRRTARDWNTRTPMQRRLLVDAIHLLRGAVAQSVADRD